MLAITRDLAILVVAVALAACASGPGATSSGAELAADVGCNACHTDSDTDIAPTLRGIWGASVRLDDGRTLVVDEAYVRNSLVDPSEEIVDGYDDRMPAFPLTDGEIARLVDYVRSLS